MVPRSPKSSLSLASRSWSAWLSAEPSAVRSFSAWWTASVLFSVLALWVAVEVAAEQFPLLQNRCQMLLVFNSCNLSNSMRKPCCNPHLICGKQVQRVSDLPEASRFVGGRTKRFDPGQFSLIFCFLNHAFSLSVSCPLNNLLKR